MKKYNPAQNESKWQKVWSERNFDQAVDFSEKPKKYILAEFPYLSGAGLHVGHVWGYTMGDVVARYYRMKGENVLYPMGWDAFGLPAENYAIKTGIHPSTTVSENIKTFKEQMESLGLSFDWSREIDTSDPNYYEWTQWIFLQLFKKGLAYKKEIAINWCPKCKLGLADEEVLSGGIHERCGSRVTRRMLSQWLLKITAYADRLVDDLKNLDWPDEIKQQQINWIGRSKGVEIDWRVDGTGEILSTFTTRLDTIYGVTFLVLAPEHPIAATLLSLKLKPSTSFRAGTQNSKLNKLKWYVKKVKSRSTLEREILTREKTGVDTDLKAIHPLTGEKIPIWVADFVLMDYGTGAIMGVPAHDERDFEFAQKFGLPIVQVIQPSSPSLPSHPSLPYEGDGILINSDKFNNLSSKQAQQKILEFLQSQGQAEKKVTYHLRDWVFSRQHYWGEPIPVIFCANCAKNQAQSPKPKAQKEEGKDYILKNGKEWAIVPVPEEDLPVELPYVEKFKPTKTGESPLAVISEWVNVACPDCGGPARRETDTMPNWAGSSWYYLAYTFWHKLGNQKSKIKNQKNSQESVFGRYKNLIDYWMPIDLYIGGAEHTTLHLLYSRFWHKFLYDLGVVPTKEPYQARVNRGIILGENHRKMSKSFGNIINPDDVVKEYGADTLRLYELFLGPYSGTFPWNTQGVKGVRRFLGRVWGVVKKSKIKSKKSKVRGRELKRSLHRLIKKVGEDIENLKFNTAIAALMKFLNEWEENFEQSDYKTAKIFLLLLAPFAPYISEELWQEIQNQKSPACNASAGVAGGNVKGQKLESIHVQAWPKFDPKLVEEETVTIVVQVNGKIRETIKSSKLKAQSSKLIEEEARKFEKVQRYLKDRKIRDVVFVPGRIINFVTAHGKR